MRVYSTVAEKTTCWWWLEAVTTGAQSFLLITGVEEVRKQREMNPGTQIDFFLFTFFRLNLRPQHGIDHTHKI